RPHMSRNFFMCSGHVGISTDVDTEGRILGEPGAQRRPRAASRLAAIAVVAGQTLEPELQYHLGGARRPDALALDVSEALEETADVKQQAGELRARRVERGMHAPPRRDHRVGEVRNT